MRNAIVITTTNANVTETKKFLLGSDSSININISVCADEDATEPEPASDLEPSPTPSQESQPAQEPVPEPTPEPKPVPVPQKPSHNPPVNVVCLGDSLTNINSFPEHYSWTTTVQDNRPDLYIVNSGIHGGYTYDFMKEDRKTIDMNKINAAVLNYHPSGVLITLGGNDIVTSTEQPKDIFERYKTIVQLFRKQGIKVVMGLYELTQTMCNNVVAAGVSPHSKTMLKLRFSTYNQLIKGWAKDWKDPQPVISIYSYLTKNKEVASNYLRPGDAVHLSQEAAEIVGNGITNTLSDWFDWLE